MRATGTCRACLGSLVALLLVSYVLSAPSSLNDPFRAIALHAPREPEQPVCCLIPLPPAEQLEDESLLSFEEWKERQSSAHAANHSTSSTSHQMSSVPLDPSDSLLPTPTASDASEEETTAPPHFRVPLTDRFNYASLDCSARVHTSHKSAKSPSFILSSKKDKYMLSPCNSKENKFVVVELCEDIRIDTVQLANFEFFSGVFKDFTFSVAKRYSMDEEDWTEAGKYTAKNIRGVQSFHPPTSLRDFYRFIRIDFHTHYSNEYYCPVSLLRVYGLTHLEEWKWEIWEEESRAKRDVLGAAEKQHTEPPATLEGEEPKPTLSLESVQEADASSAVSSSSLSSNPAASSATSMTESSNSTSTSSEIARVESAPNVDFSAPMPEFDEPQNTTIQAAASTTSTLSTALTVTPEESNSVSSSTTSGESSSPLFKESVASRADMDKRSSTLSTTIQSLSSTPSPSVQSGGTSVSSTSSSSSLSHSPSPSATGAGGESIYRTIMNRLTALESNHTLYSRYVEEQTGAMREMLRRLSEDVGRLDGLGKAQAQQHQKSVKQLERESRGLERRFRELSGRVDHLTNEIRMEKRLSIAQLLLLLVVLVFMALTRGSRGGDDSLTEHAPFLMREWSRRHLSFGGAGDWVSKLTGGSRSGSRTREDGYQHRASRKQSPVVASKVPKMEKTDAKLEHDDMKVEFPTSDINTLLLPSLQKSSKKPRTPRRESSMSRPRTPSSIRSSALRQSSHHHHHYHVAMNAYTPSATPSRPPPPPLKRANSQGSTSRATVGPVPQSAKRWARTAHLHEVAGPTSAAKSPCQGEGTEGGGGDELDQSSSLPPSGGTARGKLIKGLQTISSGLLNLEVAGEDPAWVDTDAATSVEDSDDGEGGGAS